MLGSSSAGSCSLLLFLFSIFPECCRFVRVLICLSSWNELLLLLLFCHICFLDFDEDRSSCNQGIDCFDLQVSKPMSRCSTFELLGQHNHSLESNDSNLNWNLTRAST